MTHGLVCAVLATFALLAQVQAQNLRGGDLVVCNLGSPYVFKVASNGAVSVLAAAPFIAGPSGVLGDRDGSLVVCDTQSNRLMRIASAGAITTIAQNLSVPLRVMVDRDGSYLVTLVSPTTLIDRVARDGTVTPFLLAGAGGMRRAFHVMLDGDGHYVACDDLGNGVYRIDPAGLVTPIHVGAPLRLPQGAALFPNGDYAVFDGLTDSIWRLDRTTGVPTTWVSNAALGGNPCGITAAGDGGFYVSLSGATGNSVVHVAAGAVVTQVASGAPFTNLEDCAVVPYLRGPNGFSTGPGSVSSLNLDLPALPATLYTVALSGSLFPGLTLPGEARAMTLTTDGLMLATIFSNLAPVLTAWTGFTGNDGRAYPRIDLSSLPVGLLAGHTLHAQGLALHPAAPNGIVTITNTFSLSFH